MALASSRRKHDVVHASLTPAAWPTTSRTCHSWSRLRQSRLRLCRPDYGHVHSEGLYCVFVSLTVKAVHLEVILDLTADAFLAALWRFIARRGKPTLIWSDNGSNFVGADCEIKNLFKFLHQQKTKFVVSEFCSTQGIWVEVHPTHLGGLWEATVKSTKWHCVQCKAHAWRDVCHPGSIRSGPKQSPSSPIALFRWSPRASNTRILPHWPVTRVTTWSFSIISTIRVVTPMAALPELGPSLLNTLVQRIPCESGQDEQVESQIS